MDPTKSIPNGTTGGTALAAIYDVLMRYDHEDGTYKPQLAESLESEDFITWTLKLRDGVEFSDGTPLDSQAVTASIERYISEQGHNSGLLVENIEDMAVVDPLTVEFRLKRKWVGFPYVLTAGAGMVVAPTAGEGDAFTPIGAGPFNFKEYRPSESLTLVANENYWDGRPHLDSVQFVWLGAQNTTLEALNTNSVDIGHLRDAQTVKSAIEADYAGFLEMGSAGTLLWINQREGRIGADIEFRRALLFAADAEMYAERVQGVPEVAGKSLIYKGSRNATDVDAPATDLEAAKQELVQAGMQPEDLSFTLSSSSTPDAALAIKATYEQLGLTVEVDQAGTPVEHQRKVAVDHDYDVAFLGFTIPDSEPYVRLMQLHSTSRNNPSGYTSPEMDKLLTELQAASSQDEVQEVMSEIEKVWNRDIPAVVLAADSTFTAWNGEVHGILATSELMMLLHDAWRE